MNTAQGFAGAIARDGSVFREAKKVEQAPVGIDDLPLVVQDKRNVRNTVKDLLNLRTALDGDKLLFYLFWRGAFRRSEIGRQSQRFVHSRTHD